MSVGFGDDFKEQVRAATNIVDVVAETVPLTPQGGLYVGLCPFHDDKNPSLNVYPDRQSYRCWSCNEGGDCFRFVMEIDKVTFPEALEALARRANLEMPKRTRSEFAVKTENRKSDQYEIVEWAINLMQEALRHEAADGVVQRYVKARNLEPETVTQFRLGYHPEDWGWLLQKAKGRFTEKQLLSVGLVGERDNNRGYYDNLVGRLVFPIIDERKRPVAFGGRVLPGSNIESPAKYWNSPESNIFLKRRTLYAFDQARDKIRTSREAIVVEGYMDCIACHQAGVSNVVATLGTALTEDHVKFLQRFVDRVILIYDGDRAGREAAEKSIERFLAQNLDLRILTLSEGQDPADYLENHGKDEFESLIATAPEAWAYKLQALTARYGAESVAGRQQLVDHMTEFLATAVGLQGTMREDLIIRNVCQRVQVDEMTLRKQLRDIRRRKKHRNTLAHQKPDVPAPVLKTMTGADLAEQELLEIILCQPQIADHVRHEIGPDDFNIPQHRHLLELCFDLVTEEGLLPDAKQIMAVAESDSAVLNLINSLLDSARAKGVANLMNELPLEHEAGGGTGVAPHLERVIHSLHLRRAKNQIMLSKQQLTQTHASTSELHSDKMAALRRIEKLRKREMGNG